NPPPAPTPDPPGPTAPAPPEPTGAPIAHETYVNPAQLTGLPFGDRSHWAQPWRAYSDTQPATMLQDAVGINFDVSPSQADSTARLLAANGFRRARVEVQWDTMSYDDPSTFATSSALSTKLQALHKYGIRPLILLNANQTDPTPFKAFSARITQSAAAGATKVQLDAATAAQVVPGHSGLNSLSGYPTAARYIFTSVNSSNVATLSQPLPSALAAGSYGATTLRFAPFGQPNLADGSPNPRFNDTLGGWDQFVGAVTHLAHNIIGSDAFDVEVWNETGFGSDFLYINRYYSPAPVESGDTFNAILTSTVNYIRDPANGVSGVGVGDGFANERPWDSGANTPAGLTAIDRHPYRNFRAFPSQAVYNNLKPMNALGSYDGYQDSSGNYHDNFVPTYDSYLPEYFLTGIQTETMIRDISPITTYVGSVAHGRFTHQPGAAPPGLWITEYNLDPAGDISGDADVAHMRAKMALRALTAYVNKGVSALDFYAAHDPNYALVDSSFYSALSSGYPGDTAGGTIIDTIRRLAASLNGATTISSPRSLTLSDIGDFNGHKQFSGDGTAAHPALYNRDVVAFFPFQVNTHRFVIPTYVMTRSLATVYKPSAPASDPTRFDMPPEWYRLTIDGVDGSAANVSATDPLTGDSVGVDAVARTSSSITVDIPLTDSPRLLTIDDGS
ncbi:MAG TPA: hypothetical protein VJU60_03315, partial [Thermoleophilaceae bacterium]|nr:hypothetical protein [Thermoleophilaceae bacterium]